MVKTPYSKDPRSLGSFDHGPYVLLQPICDRKLKQAGKRSSPSVAWDQIMETYDHHRNTEQKPHNVEA